MVYWQQMVARTLLPCPMVSSPFVVSLHSRLVWLVNGIGRFALCRTRDCGDYDEGDYGRNLRFSTPWMVEFEVNVKNVFWCVFLAGFVTGFLINRDSYLASRDISWFKQVQVLTVWNSPN